MQSRPLLAVSQALTLAAALVGVLGSLPALAPLLRVGLDSGPSFAFAVVGLVVGGLGSLLAGAAALLALVRRRPGTDVLAAIAAGALAGLLVPALLQQAVLVLQGTGGFSIGLGPWAAVLAGVLAAAALVSAVLAVVLTAPSATGPRMGVGASVGRTDPSWAPPRTPGR